MICEVKDFKDIYLWYPGAEFVQKIQKTRSNFTELFILFQYNIDHRYEYWLNDNMLVNIFYITLNPNWNKDMRNMTSILLFALDFQILIRSFN